MPHLFLGNSGQSAIVEPFLEGEFRKYIGNEMVEETRTTDSVTHAVLALAHFAHDHTKGKLILTDLQGT